MCTIAAALGGLSSVASFAGQQQAASAANSASLANAQSASLAAGWKYSDAGNKFIYDSKALQREAGKAVLAGRAAVSSGVASAGSAGASGISLGALIADARQTAAENAYTATEKRDDLFTSLITQRKSYEAEAQGRINSMPMTAGPSPLSLALNIGTSALGGYASANNLNTGIWAGVPGSTS